VYNQADTDYLCLRDKEIPAPGKADDTVLRTVFMGSDPFSVPSLEACIAHAEVVGVFTQPDRRSGRGRKRISVSPVKALAVEHGLDVEQPERFDKSSVERLRALEPDLTVVAAYGRLLPPAALAVARVDSINVHASLLPRHRGAAPMAAAILAGDAEAGVTVMKLRPRLDAGEIVCFADGQPVQRSVTIADNESAGQLSERLAVLGGELLADALLAIADGSVTYRTQDEAGSTYAPMLDKADGQIDWSQPAAVVARHIRAMTPWPGAFSVFGAPGQPPCRIIVVSARPNDATTGQPPGRAVVDDARLMVGAGPGSVELLELKPAGRNVMSAGAFIRGCKALHTELGQGGECWFGRA
jgi:methionyl-tRNA formyltransferase